MIGEEDVLRSLRHIAGLQDPVPPEVLAAARASLSWRDPDAALAQLVADSTADRLLAVRGAPTPRLLSFFGGTLTIDVQVTTRQGVVEVVGTLTPAMPARIVVESPAGNHETQADEDGRFKIQGLPTGPIRLRCEPATERAFSPVHTEWVLL